jgi:hypothetical protein
MLQHARRVRVLDYRLDFSGSKPLQWDLWKSYIDASGVRRSYSGLFPNLRRLEWRAAPRDTPRVANAPSIVDSALFMHPGLRELGFHLSYVRDRQAQKELKLFLVSPPPLPTLESLKMSTNKALRSAEEVCSWIRQMRSLRQLTMPVFRNSSLVMEAAAALPHLDEFELMWTQSVMSNDPVVARPVLAPDAFSALGHLAMCGSLEDIGGVLEHRFARNLSSLKTQSTNFFESPSQVATFLSQLPSRCTQLKSLVLELRATPRAVAFVNPEVPLGFEDIRPVCALQKLERLCIYHTIILAINDADLDALLCNMPQLIELRLGSRPVILDEPCPSPLSLAALHVVSRRCPQMERLGLFLETDLSSIATAQADPSAPPFRFLSELDMGSSLLRERNIEGVYAGLSRVLPSYCSISSGVGWVYVSRGPLTGDHYGEGYYEKMWEKLRELFREVSGVDFLLRALVIDIRGAALLKHRGARWHLRSLLRSYDHCVCRQLEPHVSA